MKTSSRGQLVAVLTLTGVSFVALMGLGWRSLDRSEVAIARVLREASAYSAQAAAQQIQREFKLPVFNLLEQVDHPAIKNFQLPKITQTLRDRAESFPLIDTFFVWSLNTPINAAGDAVGGDGAILFYLFSSANRASLDRDVSVDAAANGFFADPRLAAVVLDEARKFAPLRKNFALSYLDVDGRLYHVVYHFLYDENDRRLLWGFVGFLADTEKIRQTYFADVVAKWRRGEAQGDGFPPLAVSIVDHEGREVTRSGRSLLETYEAEAHFPLLFFDTDLFESLSPHKPEVLYWSVRTGYEGGTLEAIVWQETMHHYWAWLLVGLGAVVGIALTTRATIREMRLAQMKSDFVASVSHDLKTPLAKIQLFAETLESGRARTPEKVHSYHRVIRTQATKLGDLIAELLDFSRIEAGVRKYHLQELDLRVVLRSAIETLDDELSQDGFDVKVVVPEGEVPVWGNPEGLKQLFGNLIGNAMKYSPEERFLHAELSVTNGQAVVTVTDRGIGIPRREQRKIFRKFYRGNGAARLAAPGSGIGLAIVNHVARAHGGRVLVTSVVGRGSTFTVKLPLAPECDGGSV